MNNLSFLNTRAFPCAAVLLATAVGLGASEKIDLSRTQPVPANEQIPIMDFFRPPSMAYPVLNRAGTHFAAFISAGRDQLDMLIYNLETNKGETLLTTGDRDVEVSNGSATTP